MSAQPKQSKYSDIVSDGGLDPRNKFDAQPEQDQLSDAMSVLADVNADLIAEAKLAQPEQEPFKPDWVSYRQGVADGAAQSEQEEPLPLVDIGVDVTPEGTHVVACYNRPDVVQKMFYSQFHPLTKPEQEPKLSDAGVDTNIPLWGLEPKGSGMVTLNQVGMRVDLKDGTCKEWVGLTDDEIEAMYLSFTLTNNHSEPNRFVRLIEAKLKELNR